MKTRTWLVIGLIVALAVPAWPASADDGESALLRLLRFVPNTPASRAMVTFGDVAAWHASWGVPRLDDLDALDALPRDPRAYWMFVLGRQTAPPDNLGLQYLMSEDQRGFYGFDFFNVDRFIYGGTPPDTITVVEHNRDAMSIANALLTSGYATEALADDWALYSILDDYQTAMPGGGVELPRMGMLGQLNRIALRDVQMIIARATANVSAALDAQAGNAASLADYPPFAAAARALDDPLLADTGDLVGAFLLDGPALLARLEPAALLGAATTPEELEKLREQLGLDRPNPLRPYLAVAFATRHTPGASYLILAVVFPPETDAEAASAILSERLQSYVSGATHQPMSDRWAFDRAGAATIDGWPVALVTMRVDDPPPAPEGERANAAVLGWADMIYRNDLGFLAAAGLES